MWPIKVLRWYAIIFFQVLQVAVFKLYLMALDCQVGPYIHAGGAGGVTWQIP